MSNLEITNDEILNHLEINNSTIRSGVNIVRLIKNALFNLECGLHLATSSDDIQEYFDEILEQIDAMSNSELFSFDENGNLLVTATNQDDVFVVQWNRGYVVLTQMDD